MTHMSWEEWWEKWQKEEGKGVSDPEFFQTPLGKRFYERDVPELVAVLKRIADSMEKLVEKIEELEKEGR